MTLAEDNQISNQISHSNRNNSNNYTNYACATKRGEASQYNVSHDIPLPTSAHFQNSDNQRPNACQDSSENKLGEDLSILRAKNYGRLICGHLNINSIRNKFICLEDLVKTKMDILLISETKINETFLSAQFLISGFQLPYRLDRSEFGGGLLLYVRENIPSKEILSLRGEIGKGNDFECLFVEINLNKKKWLIVGTYNPSNILIKKHLVKLSSYMDILCTEYDNILIMGDFNSEPSENELKDFCNLFCLRNLINEPTCFKNLANPKCIDLILTNRPNLFQNSGTIETGISDFHKMTITVMKAKFKKLPPKIITYRNYKGYSHTNFNLELRGLLNHHNNLYNLSNDEFAHMTMNLLDRHAPLKQKYLRANQGPFMTKDLQKAIMLRTKLRNKSLTLKTDASYNEYKQQRNVCTYLVRKAKKDYYSNLDPTKICDNKKFWNTVKPLFSEKSIKNSNITLIEDNEIINDDLAVAHKLNDFFSTAVSKLDIKVNKNIIIEDFNETDPILYAINKYRIHPSIIKINESQENLKDKQLFSFNGTTYENVYNEILALNLSKAASKNSIPTKIIKENCDLFAKKIHVDFDYSIFTGTFPNNLKMADITPTHKRGNHNDKSNYRAVSILPGLSKVFERLLFYQMHTFAETNLSIYQCGFRKGYSSQHCLLLLIEKWKKSIDNKKSSGVLLTDLSKAFDCLSHDLLIAKLHAYGFDYKALQLLNSYLTNRYQRVRINSSYSTWSDIINGVPQGSILGPTLFNIYLSDLFLFTKKSDIANYADDNSPYVVDTTIESVMNRLESDTTTLLNWVSDNSLKANPDKFHLLLSSKNHNLSIKVDERSIKNSESEKLLGITIDNALKFDNHVNKLCKKASGKLHALGRVAKYMDVEKRRKIMNAFINSQFSYCPLVWMFHSRTLNNQINRIHERALRIVYNDKNSSLNQLLFIDESFTIHERNIQTLAVELFKIIHGLSPEIMKDILPLKEKNNYCTNFPFKTRNVHTVTYGTETISYLGPKIWSLIPDHIKTSSTLLEFKSKIKKWKPINCPCRLCKIYLPGIGFIDVT